MNPVEIVAELSELPYRRVRSNEQQYPPLYSRRRLQKLTPRVKQVVQVEEPQAGSCSIRMTLYLGDLVVQE